MNYFCTTGNAGGLESMQPTSFMGITCARTPLLAIHALANHELANLARILLEKSILVGQWLCCMWRGSVHE